MSSPRIPKRMEDGVLRSVKTKARKRIRKTKKGKKS